jgi:hypothetical protein
MQYSVTSVGEVEHPGAKVWGLLQRVPCVSNDALLYGLTGEHEPRQGQGQEEDKTQEGAPHDEHEPPRLCGMASDNSEEKMLFSTDTY